MKKGEGFYEGAGKTQNKMDFALSQLTIRKGFITKEEFFEPLKEVQAEYQKNEPGRQ